MPLITWKQNLLQNLFMYKKMRYENLYKDQNPNSIYVLEMSK